MSEINVKSEPADKGYEAIVAAAESVVSVKTEPASDAPEPARVVDASLDDLDWVNDELDFLNDIADINETGGAVEAQNGDPTIPKAIEQEATPSANDRSESGESPFTVVPVNVNERDAKILNEMQLLAKTIEKKKQTETIPSLKIKAEKVTPPREIPPAEIFTRRVKEERVTPPRTVPRSESNETARHAVPSTSRRSPSPVQRKSRSPSPSARNRSPPPSLAHRRRTPSPPKEQQYDYDESSVSDIRGPKRAASSQDMPLPKKIKTEPVDTYSRPTDRITRPNNSLISDSSYDMDTSDRDSSRSKESESQMPLPFRIKQERMDTNDSASTSNESFRLIKDERADEQPIGDRSKTLNFIQETIKNFSLFTSSERFKTRMLYTPTTLIRAEATQLTANRSPLIKSSGIQFEFSAPRKSIDTEKWGIRKLSQRSSQIVHLLGFNAYDLAECTAALKLGKLDSDDADTIEDRKPIIKTESYYVDAETQTTDLKCNVCIVRRLKRYADRSTQVQMATAATSTVPTAAVESRNSALYESIPKSMIESLSQMATNQQTALQEFIELILGPAPTSTNDITRMRERLMDIFTLAQSARSTDYQRMSPIPSNPLEISRPLPQNRPVESSPDTFDSVKSLACAQLSRNFSNINSNYPSARNIQTVAAPQQNQQYQQQPVGRSTYSQHNQSYSPQQMSQFSPQVSAPFQQQQQQQQRPIQSPYSQQQQQPIQTPYIPQPVPSPFAQQPGPYQQQPLPHRFPNHFNNHQPSSVRPIPPAMFPNPAARPPMHNMPPTRPRLVDPRINSSNNIQVNTRPR